MLSITPLKTAQKASNYYINEEKNLKISDISLTRDGQNYYLQERNQGENTFWFGKIADESGLAGQPIKENQLTEILSGELNGEAVHAKREKHKPGFDFTLSAPKSLSILALAGGDDRLLTIHDEGVKYVLNEIEKDTAQAKVTDKESGVMEYQNTQSMIFGVVRHKTSREDDPQIHSHALGANMTRDDNGKLRALASCLKQNGGIINGTAERIYNNQKYYTALYHSFIGKRSEEIGYTLRAIGNNQIELAEVPENVIEHFSKRSAQIEQKTLDLGYDTQASRDIAAKNTRKNKSHASDESLNVKWQSELQSIGFNPQKVVESTFENITKAQSIDTQFQPEAIEALNLAIAHMSQTSTAISLEKLVTIASSEFVKGSNIGQITAIDIKQAVDKLIDNGTLIPLKEKSGLFTSQQMLDNENALLSVTEGRATHMSVIPNREALNQLKFNQSNVSKLENIFESTKQFNVVNVFGTTQQLAESLLHVGSESGKRVHIISVSSIEKKRSDELINKQIQNPLL